MITATALCLYKFELLLHPSDSSNRKRSITVLHIKKNGFKNYHGRRGNLDRDLRDSFRANYDHVLKSKLLYGQFNCSAT